MRKMLNVYQNLRKMMPKLNQGYESRPIQYKEMWYPTNLLQKGRLRISAKLLSCLKTWIVAKYFLWSFLFSYQEGCRELNWMIAVDRVGRGHVQFTVTVILTSFSLFDLIWFIFILMTRFHAQAFWYRIRHYRYM